MNKGERVMSDLISRQAAIDALRYAQHRFTVADEAGGMGTVKWSEDVIYFAAAERVLSELPSAQPEPAIPLQWIEAQIEWLKSLDNAFSTLTARVFR